MSLRVDSSLTTHLNSTSLGLPTQSAPVQTLGQQVQQTLFGRVKPKQLDSNDYPELQELLRILNKYKRKLAMFAGDADEDYELVLALDTIAAIDATGTIYLGMAFLQSQKHNLETLVGVLAHEIGHQPKRWKQTRYELPYDISRHDMAAMCRHEETLADRFAGKALAELQFTPKGVTQLLKIVQQGSHPEYLPVEQRIAVIEEAYAGSYSRVGLRKKLFPAYHRYANAKNHLRNF